MFAYAGPIVFAYAGPIVFAYAGPIVGAFVINATGALIATLCVYLYLNRQKFRKYKFLTIISKPFHGIIKKIAIKNIEKQDKNNK